MKKMMFIGLGSIFIAITACNQTSRDKSTHCMHCTGCFNTWDECEADYKQDSLHPYTWEQYVDSTIAQNTHSTNHCERME